jgi:hypothetical protein
MAEDLQRDNEQLLEFLYACPVGLVEFDAMGTIMMINPHAMKHLLPVAGMRDPGNLFAMLEGCAPELRNLFVDYPKDRGPICEGHRIAVDMATGRNGKDPKVLACTLVKLGPNRAMATFADITVQVAQERRLKQSETWFGSLINAVNDYAVLSITADGTIDGANAAFTRQSGRVVEDVTGMPLDRILDVATGFGRWRINCDSRSGTGGISTKAGRRAAPANATGANGCSQSGRRMTSSNRTAISSCCAMSRATGPTRQTCAGCCCSII